MRRLGQRYYTDFKFKGQRIRRVMPEARTADQAKRLEAKIRDGYFEGSYGEPAAATKFIDFARAVWLPYSAAHKRSHRADLRHFRTFQTYFAQKTFADFSSLLIEKFKRDRLQKLQPASVNRELAALSKIFSLAIAQKVTSENPVRQVKRLVENNQRTRFLLPDEETRLLDACQHNPTLAALVRLALNTGLRRGELLKLEWRDVDWAARTLKVRETKSGHDRSVPLNASARAVFNVLPHAKTQTWVFPSRSSSGHLTDFKRSWTKALRQARIEDFHFHDLRHTAGTRLAATGAHPNTIKVLLGHQNLATTERYMHALDEDKRQACAALEDFGQKYGKAENLVEFKKALNR